jgi:CheY-like chemotaxis protein
MSPQDINLDRVERTNDDAALDVTAHHAWSTDEDGAPSPAAAAGRDERNYLVVDGEAAVREQSIETLKRLGADQMATVADGDQALAYLDASGAAPDVIMTKLVLPGMSGVDMLRSLAERTYAGAVLLVSDADDDTLSVAKGMARYRGLNVIGSIAKPMTLQSLELALNSADHTEAEG